MLMGGAWDWLKWWGSSSSDQVPPPRVFPKPEPIAASTERLGSELLGEIAVRGGLPRPDWDAVLVRWEALPVEQRDAAWLAVERVWLERLAEAWRSAGREDFRVWSSERLCLATDLPTRLASAARQRLVLWIDAVDRGLGRLGLGPIGDPERFVPEEWAGGDVVILCTRYEEFLDYIDDVYPEEYRGGLMAGVCLFGGAVHVALWGDDLARIDGVFCHELIHTRTCSYHLPTWLDEGLTSYLETRSAAGTDWLRHDAELLEGHRAFWNPERLDRFFEDPRFTWPEDELFLAYHLAATIVLRMLESGVEAFGSMVRCIGNGTEPDRACRTFYGDSFGRFVPDYASCGSA